MNTLANNFGIIGSFGAAAVQAEESGRTTSYLDSAVADKNILIIDDDQFLLDIYSKRLREHGYDVTTVTSAEDALNELRSGKSFDLMLIDVVMPGMSGLEFMQKMQEENLGRESIKVILSNMSDQTEIMEKGNNLGATKYILKAEVTSSDVLNTINRLFS